MVADVTTDEVFRLARAMTLKNSGADLAHEFLSELPKTVIKRVELKQRA